MHFPVEAMTKLWVISQERQSSGSGPLHVLQLWSQAAQTLVLESGYVDPEHSVTQDVALELAL